MGDAVDEHCLQNPLDVVEGVAHAGQAAKDAHTFTYNAELGVIHQKPNALGPVLNLHPKGCLLNGVQTRDCGPVQIKSKLTLTGRPSACCW